MAQLLGGLLQQQQTPQVTIVQPKPPANDLQTVQAQLVTALMGHLQQGGMFDATAAKSSPPPPPSTPPPSTTTPSWGKWGGSGGSGGGSSWKNKWPQQSEWRRSGYGDYGKDKGNVDDATPVKAMPALPRAKAAAEQPDAEKPAADKPDAKPDEKPDAEKPAAEKPAAEKPAAEKPAEPDAAESSAPSAPSAPADAAAPAEPDAAVDVEEDDVAPEPKRLCNKRRKKARNN